MTNTSDPLSTYNNNLQEYQRQLSSLLSKKNLFGWLRLLALITAGMALYFLWPSGLTTAFGVFFIVVALFLYLVSLDVKNKTVIENTRLLIRINEEEIAYLKNQYAGQPDGLAYQPAIHEYSHDLDVFGPNSLFQFINRTTSDQGNAAFTSWLLAPSLPETVLARQVAVKELSKLTNWRQQLQAYGTSTPIRRTSEENIRTWLPQPDRFLGNTTLTISRWLLPALALSTLLLHITGHIPSPVFYAIALVFMTVAFAISGKVMPLYKQLNKITREMEVLANCARLIEGQTFASPLLKALQDDFQGQGTNASVTIRQLNAILNRMDYRFNILLFIPLNTFLFWDLQLAFQLEAWKSRHRLTVEKWFRVIGEFEALSSLATLAFNHPSWTFPKLVKEDGVFKAENLGHPLIPADKMVMNSFYNTGLQQLALITGSNMAGKSTFLRSVGVNIVLAMMGGPVYATALTLSPMKVMSSMRVTDNLSESTSTFYAELKKLKQIIEAVRRHEKLFLLLDEILRGTNSLDRHAGSKALIKQLLEQQAVGMLATHDLELARLSEDYPNSITNYHFDVQVENDELYFDYQLKEGVCRSMNASILMKKIGIEL